MRTVSNHLSLGWIGANPTAWLGAVNPIPDDFAISSTTVTFDGVIAGSEIRVYDASLNELAGIESCAANQQLTWPVYASGSPNNNVEIKIYNTGYRLKKFPYTSKVGDQSIPVQMERDRWYNNP